MILVKANLLFQKILRKRIFLFYFVYFFTFSRMVDIEVLFVSLLLIKSIICLA